MKYTVYQDNTERNEIFERLCLKTQKQMKKYVEDMLRKRHKGFVSVGDGYVYYKGTFPVLLLAHMDTVHEKVPRTFVYANGTVSSPQGIGGDDRCGIYMIFEILKKYDCHVVFLEDEEIGCVGAKKFAKSVPCANLKNQLRFLLEFDRKGNNHMVTYDCDNPEFDNFMTEDFFEKQTGTCSDISYIAPAIGVAAANLSCGYYNEHHIEHHVNLKEMQDVIDNAEKVLERSKELKKPFEYIENKTFGYYGYGAYRSYMWDDDDYYDYSWSRNKTYRITYKKKGKKKNSVESLSISTTSEDSAVHKFMKWHPTVCYADIIVIEEV